MDAARRERRHHRKEAAPARAAAGAAATAGGAGGTAAAAAAARAAYGDVFGGPPRFAAPFGGAPLDYAEVFGGVAATCSIPYLDLPHAAAVGGDDGFFAAGGKGDYGEIFGRFDFADFAVPYEDLFGEPEPAPERLPEIEEVASSSGSSRSSLKKEYNQLESEPPIHSQHYQNLDHPQHVKEHKLSNVSFPSDTGSHQFLKSHNKTTERRLDDLVEMTTCTVEPLMDFVIDSHNLSADPIPAHVSRINNGKMANGHDERYPNYGSASVKNPQNGFAVDQKQQSRSCRPVSGHVSDPSYGSASVKDLRSDFEVDQKQQSPSCPPVAEHVSDPSSGRASVKNHQSDFAVDQKQQRPSCPPVAEHVSDPSSGRASVKNHQNDFAYDQKQQSPSCPPVSGHVLDPSYDSASVKNPQSGFAVDQKQQSPLCPPISGNASVNKNKSTDIRSTHSRGTKPDYAFLHVSDADTKIHTMRVQPPSRQQPKPLIKKERADKGDADTVKQNSTPTSSAKATFSSNVLQVDKKADGPRYNTDTNRVSASAAMKEAMDFAEARLKAAKELLERSGDSFKLWKGPSFHRSTISTETKAAEPSIEVDAAKQNLSVEKPSIEGKSTEDTLSDKHKKISAVRLDHFDDNGKRVLPPAKPQQMMQKGIESCQTCSKLEKLGNWRSGDEYYELTGDDQRRRTDEATGEDGKCELMNPITSHNNDKTSETECSTAGSDLERNEKLWEVNDGRDLGAKHVNRNESNEVPVDKEKASVMVEASTENMAPEEIHDSNLEGLEDSKESHGNEQNVDLPYMGDTSTKLDFIKDMSGSLSEACLSGNHGTDLRDLSNSCPTVSSVAGASLEPTNSKPIFEVPSVVEVPCDVGMQCPSESSVKNHESSEVSNVDISQGSNIKSLILEELEESYLLNNFSRGLNRAEEESETYGREKFSFIDESLLYRKDAKIKELLSEEVKKLNIEENVSPCVQHEEAVVDVDTECPEKEADITSQNMLNAFEVASNLIKRDLDQETQGSLGHGGVGNKVEGAEELILVSKGKDAEEIPLEDTGKIPAEEASACGSQEEQESSESSNKDRTDIFSECDTTVEVSSKYFVGDEVIAKATTDSTTRSTIDSKDDLASCSDMNSFTQHSTTKDESATCYTSNSSVPVPEETGEVRNRGERESQAERSTCEEKRIMADKVEEKNTTARTPKEENGPSPLKKASSLPKSAGCPSPVSAEALKKEAHGFKREKERENIRRTESASEMEKVSFRRTEEAKENGRRQEKERLAEERERRKLEEEREREMERKKDRDRLAVERATREAHERAFAEAREKAEKMASDRISAARHRASAEAREKEERAKASAEVAAREARIKAERAAVERATAEARERAIEKAKAEIEAKERRERYRSSFKESFKSTNQDIRQETQFQRAASGNSIRNPDSCIKVVEVESALRHKARLERHQRTAERVTKALAEKNMRDILAQREQAEKHRLSEFLDPEIKRWSNGKEGNLRALLSTLQYILGSDSGWQPVPLTELITAAAVKKAYRKATLCVHPDKLQQRGATIRQKYICEKVFDLLKDAWNKFTSEER